MNHRDPVIGAEESGVGEQALALCIKWSNRIERNDSRSHGGWIIPPGVAAYMISREVPHVDIGKLGPGPVQDVVDDDGDVINVNASIVVHVGGNQVDVVSVAQDIRDELGHVVDIHDVVVVHVTALDLGREVGLNDVGEVLPRCCCLVGRLAAAGHDEGAVGVMRVVEDIIPHVLP